MIDDFYGQNALFDLKDSSRNRDNCLYPFFLLQQELKQRNIVLATSDIHAIEDSDIVIYNEMPVILPRPEDFQKSYLMIFESELIRPDNWDLNKHKYFNKVFTWHDDFVDNKKYIKINFSHQLPKKVNVTAADKTGFCTLIAGNKRVRHRLELYSKRVEAIRWFEQHYPEQFELYGMGWDKYRFEGPKTVRILNRIKALTSALAPKYSSYRGIIDSKYAVLSSYRFSICYENAKDIPGYITEKIFDSMFSGCIPVYWGANNIEDYIPKDCFIDKRDFESYDDLYDYLTAMSDVELNARIQSIEKFLNSNKAYLFSAECFSETIINVFTEKKDV